MKKIFLMAMCAAVFVACSDGSIKSEASVAETVPASAIDAVSQRVYEEIDTPEKAVEAYFANQKKIGALSQYEIKSVKIGQSSHYWLNHYYTRQPQKIGIADYATGAVVEYSMTTADNMSEVTEVFVIAMDGVPFTVIDKFSYDIHEFTGTISEVYTENGRVMCVIIPDEDSEEAEYGEVLGLSATIYETAEAGQKFRIRYNGEPHYFDDSGKIYIDTVSMSEIE